MAPRIWHRSVDGALMRTDELIEWVSRCMSAVGLGCAKTPTLAPHVEISLINCISESQIILHTPGSMPCWRIVFSTFRGCMSFYTARVKMRKPRNEHMSAGLPPIADIARRGWHGRKVPTPDSCSAAKRCARCTVTRSPLRRGRAASAGFLAARPANRPAWPP